MADISPDSDQNPIIVPQSSLQSPLSLHHKLSIAAASTLSTVRAHNLVHARQLCCPNSLARWSYVWTIGMWLCHVDCQRFCKLRVYEHHDLYLRWSQRFCELRVYEQHDLCLRWPVDVLTWCARTSHFWWRDQDAAPRITTRGRAGNFPNSTDIASK
jgi:hypothetical protein